MHVIPLISEEYRGPASTFIILCSCHKNVLQMEMMETVLLGKKRRRRRRKRVAVSSFFVPSVLLGHYSKILPLFLCEWMSSCLAERYSELALGQACCTTGKILQCKLRSAAPLYRARIRTHQYGLLLIFSPTFILLTDALNL